MEYVIIRGRDSGVHAGELASIDHATKSCVLHNARRIWYWSGAATLSQLAMEGAKNVKDCKFAVSVPVQEIVGDVCEVIRCSPAAEAMIRGCPEWRM